MGRGARRNRSKRSESSSASRDAGPVSVTLRSRSPWGKMSGKLQSVAEPWTSRLDDDPPESTITAIYRMANTIWNACRLPDPQERSAALEGGSQRMATALPDLPQVALQELFFGVGNFHVSVASIDVA